MSQSGIVFDNSKFAKLAERNNIPQEKDIIPCYFFLDWHWALAIFNLPIWKPTQSQHTYNTFYNKQHNPTKPHNDEN